MSLTTHAASKPMLLSPSPTTRASSAPAITSLASDVTRAATATAHTAG